MHGEIGRRIHLIIKIFTIQDYIKEDGKYCLLKRQNTTPKPRYPDGDVYDIYSPGCSDFENYLPNTFSDEELKDEAVKALKKIYGLVDPWDENPNYFNNYQSDVFTYIYDLEGITYCIEPDDNWQVGFHFFAFKDENYLFDYIFLTHVEALQFAEDNYDIELLSWELYK